MMLPVLLLGLTACEKPILSEDGSDGYSSAEANVILHFTQFEQAAFTYLFFSALQGKYFHPLRRLSRKMLNFAAVMCFKLKRR